MSHKHRLSRDQKRKKKLAKRSARERGNPLAAYHGWKSASAKYVELVFRAECGIRLADAITDESLTDHDVRASLEYLIGKLQGLAPQPPGPVPQEPDRQAAGSAPQPPDPTHPESAGGACEDLVAARIEEEWQELFHKRSRPPNDVLIGCLHAILDSLARRCTSSARSRGYLDYLVDFLAQAGFRVQRVEDVEVDEEGNLLPPAAPYRPRGNWLTRLIKRWW